MKLAIFWEIMMLRFLLQSPISCREEVLKVSLQLQRDKLPSPPVHLLMKLNICYRKRRKKLGEAKVFLPFCSWSFSWSSNTESQGEEHYKMSCLVVSPASLLLYDLQLCCCLHIFHSFLFFSFDCFGLLFCVACLVLSEHLFSFSLYLDYLMYYPWPKYMVSASALTTAGWVQARYHTLMWTWRLLHICHLNLCVKQHGKEVSRMQFQVERSFSPRKTANWSVMYV